MNKKDAYRLIYGQSCIVCRTNMWLGSIDPGTIAGELICTFDCASCGISEMVVVQSGIEPASSGYQPEALAVELRDQNSSGRCQIADVESPRVGR